MTPSNSPAIAPGTRASTVVGPRIRLQTWGITTAAVVVVDQVTKTLVLRSIDASERIEIIGSLSLVRRFNKGAAFSFGAGSSLTAWFATAIIVVITVAVVRHLIKPSIQAPSAGDWRWWVALGLIIGGGLGNQIDRFFRSGGMNRGAVVDFIDVGFWPIFNVADSALSIGCVLIALLSLRDPSRAASSALPVAADTTATHDVTPSDVTPSDVKPSNVTPFDSHLQ